MRDTFVLAREKGLATVMVTNGFINQKPLEEILPLVDAMNIDLKGFTDDFYRNLCGGFRTPVLRTIEKAVAKTHVEVTTLIIPGKNSSPEEIETLSSWLASLRNDIPLHLSRHHPDYLMPDPEPIVVEDLFELAKIARTHLQYVHVGNV